MKTQEFLYDQENIMDNGDIKDNASFKKLSEKSLELDNFRKALPLLKPLADSLGIDINSITDILDPADGLANQIDEMVKIPDKFNDLFSDHGWIIFDRMNLDTAKEAIGIYEKNGIEKAEEYLVNYFSPEWVEERKNWLKSIKGFEERFPLALKALDDYKAGRYYASVLVTLSLIDGWVNELNLIDYQRLGFFSDKSKLVAWDSIAAHPKGLPKLQEVFSKSRQRTRTEEIIIPYRNGIMHGMDLGYDNKYVAAKCWAALFAVRDWAIKAAKNEIKPPELEPVAEKTLWESIESFNNSRKQLEEYKRWQPREIIPGDSIPKKGSPDEYPQNTPERKVVDFLSYWIKNNFGHMAKCQAPFLKPEPLLIREWFQDKKLIDFELIQVIDIIPSITNVKVLVWLDYGDEKIKVNYEFRVVASLPDKKFVTLPTKDTEWAISTWSQIQ